MAPATTDHPVFSAPQETNVLIWRYMDIAKFVDLLEGRALFFPRADCLGDPFEGARSRANYDQRDVVYKDVAIGPNVHATLARIGEWERQWTYISCWHMNDHESAAMWRLYAKSNDAVAIQSTYLRLCSVLPESAFVGTVHYLDYERDWIPESNGFYRFICKRSSFAHERELRAVISELPATGADLDVNRRNPDSGKSVSIDLAELIERIYVAPTAALWLRVLIEKLTRRYGPPVPVLQSSLDAPPLF